MDSTKLTDHQRRDLLQAVRGREEWVRKLICRIHSQDWPADDPVAIAAAEASEVLHRLTSAVSASGSWAQRRIRDVKDGNV